MNRISKPASAQGSRVSPTAPESKSASANIWRMLEADPAFVEGMNKAAAEKSSDGFIAFKHARKRPAR